MKNLFLLTVLFAFSIQSAFAQSAIPRPSKANKSDDKVWISNEKDIKTFAKYLKRHGQPQTLLFAKGLNTIAFFELYSELDEVSQLVFEGNNPIKRELLCELPSLNHVIFHVGYYDSSIVKAINDCPYLTEVSYVFERDISIDKEWFDLKSITTLNVLGIFSKEQIAAIVPKIKPMQGLKQLRFSTDYTRDLPDNLNTLTQVSHFGMVDNLSFLISRTFHDLAIEKYFINYWDKEAKKSIILGFDYYSDRVSLEDYDFNHLSKVFNKAQMLPYYAHQNIDKGPNKVIGRPKVTGLSDYSIYDTTDHKAKPSIYFELNENTKPLDPKYDPSYEHFVVSPSQNAILTTIKGYKITIPANAFIDKNNQPLSRKIDIYFRLFSNIVEMGLTGLATQYDSFNDYFRLTNPSICMFYASSNNQSIKLKRGFAIDVEMPMTGSRKWELSNDVEYWYPYDPLENGAVKRHKISSLSDTFGPQQLVDKTDLNTRYFNPKYYFLLDKAEEKVKIPRSLKKAYKPNPDVRIYYPYKKGMVREKNELYLKPGKALVGARKISFKDTARRKQIFFRIYNKLDARLFPEIEYFKNYVFQYAGDESKKTFTKKLLRGKKFHDLRIFYKQGDWEGVVELKHADGYVQLPFKVVQKGNKKPGHKQKAKFLKRYLKYQSMLSKRIEAQKQHALNYNQQVNDEKPELGGITLFTITQLGSFAIADLDSAEEARSINLLINDGSGLPLDIKKIVVVYNQPKMLQYFNDNAVNLHFDREFALIVIDYKGDMYYMSASQCKALKGGEGSVKSINARRVKPEFSEADLLYKYLGFEKKRK